MVSFSRIQSASSLEAWDPRLKKSSTDPILVFKDAWEGQEKSCIGPTEHDQRTERFYLKVWNLQHLPACSAESAFNLPCHPTTLLGEDWLRNIHIQQPRLPVYSRLLLRFFWHRWATQGKNRSCSDWKVEETLCCALHEFQINSTVTMVLRLIRTNSHLLPPCMSLNTLPVHPSAPKATVKLKMQ